MIDIQMAEDKEKIVQTTIRMTEKLHMQLTSEVLRRKYTENKTSIDRLVQEALTSHLTLQRNPGEKADKKTSPIESSGRSSKKVPALLDAPPGVVIQLSRTEEPWVQKFLYILRHGDDDTREAITRNVDRFSLLARLINREAAAGEELDRIARQVADDPQRRMEPFREFEQRYSLGREDTSPDAKRVSKKRARHPSTTETGS